MSVTLKGSFPHAAINVIDKSIYSAVEEELESLHQPCFLGKAARGPINRPLYLPNTNTAMAVLGKETFEVTGEYYNNDILFLESILAYHGGWYVRLASDSAKAASLVLECHVSKTTTPTYQKDSFGNRIVDSEGEWVPVLDGSNQIVTTEAIQLKWVIRALEADENGEEIQIKTIGTGDTAVTVYPVMFVEATSPGVWGNRTGFHLFYDYNGNLSGNAADLETLFFTFAPVEKPYLSDTPAPVYNFYNEVMVDFCFKPNVIDTGVARSVSLEDVVKASYPESKALPFTVFNYAENIKLIGDRCVVAEANSEITSPWMIDILTGMDTENRPYDKIVVVGTGDGGVLMNENYTLYLQGGNDGALTAEELEEKRRLFFSMNMFPDLQDRAKYPITHFYDTGVPIESKYSMIEMMGYKDDCQVTLSSQDASRKMNSKAEDLSATAALIGRARLQPESTIMGTGACRAAVFMQCGHVHSNWKGIVPATLWMAIKRAEFFGTSWMKGSPTGRPRSEVGIFSDVNWTPSDDDFKATSWKAGGNYFQHANKKVLYYPALQTVYSYDTSVLSQLTFVDLVVFAKHYLRNLHSYYSGIDDTPFEIMAANIERQGNAGMSSITNGRYPSKITVYQTDDERKKGYIDHVQLDLQGFGNHRVWSVDIVCTRENYEG